jgi:hypothetical protein
MPLTIGIKNKMRDTGSVFNIEIVRKAHGKIFGFVSDEIEC